MSTSTCKRDGFPLTIINGRRQCVAEYLDRCIGSQKIIDVILHDGSLVYVFENGHELPLYCFCCDGPLICEDLPAYKKGIIGRRLEAMLWDIEQYADGKEAIDFRLELSSLDGEEYPLQISTSLLSAQKIRHPSTCVNRERKRLIKDVKQKSRRRSSRGRRKKKSSPARDETESSTDRSEKGV